MKKVLDNEEEEGGAEDETAAQSGPVKPALHVQSVEASLPAGEVDPAMMRSRQLAVHAASYFGYAIS